MAVKLAAGSPEHESQLATLGLEASWVREAIGAGNQERLRAVTGHAAKSASGYYGWNGTLTSLSQQCCRASWKRRDPSSLPVLINPATETVLTVSSGNSLTGFSGLDTSPTTRNPKGELTRALQRRNWEIIHHTLFDVHESPADFLSETDGYSFWVLLVYYDVQEREIRHEVSRPLKTDGRGFTETWGPRIILPPYELGNDEYFGEEDPNDGFGPYDVVVTRK